MELYTFLRHMADSWFLLAMFLFFLGAIAFLWRPGARKAHEDAATVIFRHEDSPAASASHAQHRHPVPEARS
ncbi:MAG: cbb3-type cytochrome c oxidase subunit 3 [Rhodobacterales bacterium]|jgi:cytochrome c oxidase cbb3-type subunit 4|nr:cbb3-type cytochrome c oxidase subunit 3 [Rhodobacterales bacterium]